MGHSLSARTPPRAVPISYRRDQEAARSNSRADLVSASVVEDDTWMMVETKLRVPPWLAIATIVKRHHMSTTCAAWGRPRCPHVMTTTLCVNAQELR